MRASQLADPLYDADLDLDAPEPMRPIRFEYLTVTRDIRIQTDLLERLGLVHVFVGRQLYAVNECDSNSLRLTAGEQLAAEGLVATDLTVHGMPDTAHVIARRAEALLKQAVVAQAEPVQRTAIRQPSDAVRRFAQEQRAIADRELAARGHDLKARLAQSIAEIEAA